MAPSGAASSQESLGVHLTVECVNLGNTALNCNRRKPLIQTSLSPE
jgi:hypothetical protein